MKNILQFTSIIGAVLALTFSSCHKPDYKSSNVIPVSVPTVTPTNTVTGTGPSTDKTKLNELFGGLKTMSQTFTVSAGTYQTVTGNNGTRLNFYPNSFKNASGTVITSGSVVITMKEIKTVGQMIANRATTTSGGKLLTSGGEVYITASQSGTEVYANKYGIGFQQSAPSAQRMALFYGNTSNADSITTWTVADTTLGGTLSTSTTTDTSIVDSFGVITYYHQFDSCTNFHWINCDYFYGSSSPLTDVSVVVPDTSFNQSNTEVFVVFPSITAATHMTQYSASTHTFDLSSGFHVPVGMTIEIAVVTNKGGNWYYYEQTGITTTSGISLTASMSVQSLSYILAHISAL